jgi:hypothetical protein
MPKGHGSPKEGTRKNMGPCVPKKNHPEKTRSSKPKKNTPKKPQLALRQGAACCPILLGSPPLKISQDMGEQGTKNNLRHNPHRARLPVF